MRPNEKLYKERYEFFMQQIDPDYILRMYDDCEFSEYVSSMGGDVATYRVYGKCKDDFRVYCK